MGGMRAQPICFDRSEDAVVPHVVPGPHADPWHEPAMDDDTILYLTDNQSNGRWLYVDHPDGDGDIELGVLRGFRKDLSAKAARAVAAALIQAAEESEAGEPEREAKREADRIVRVAHMRREVRCWTVNGEFREGPTYNGGWANTGPWGEPGAEPGPEVTWVKDITGRRFDRNGTDWVRTTMAGARNVLSWPQLLAEAGCVTAPAYPDEETP